MVLVSYTGIGTRTGVMWSQAAWRRLEEEGKEQFSSGSPQNNGNCCPLCFFPCMLILGEWEYAEMQKLPTGSEFWAAIRTRSSYLMFDCMRFAYNLLKTWICWGVPITGFPLNPLFPKLLSFVSSIRLAGALYSHCISSVGFLHLCLHGDFMPEISSCYSWAASYIPVVRTEDEKCAGIRHGHSLFLEVQLRHWARPRADRHLRFFLIFLCCNKYFYFTQNVLFYAKYDPSWSGGTFVSIEIKVTKLEA